MSRHGRDSGSIVLGWLTKLTVTLVLVGIVLFDSVSVGVVRMSASDDANNAASSAAYEWQRSHSLQLAFQAAVNTVTNPSEQVLSRGFTIDPDGSVHLLLRRTATTLVLYRIGSLKKYATVTAHGEASPPTQ